MVMIGKYGPTITIFLHGQYFMLPNRRKFVIELKRVKIYIKLGVKLKGLFTNFPNLHS